MAAWAGSLAGQRTDNLLELTHPEKKRVHNLKYYTWVEQQGKNIRELEAQWARRRTTGRPSSGRPRRSTS